MDTTTLYQKVKTALDKATTPGELKVLLNQVLDLDEQAFGTAPAPGQSWAKLGAQLVTKIYEP